MSVFDDSPAAISASFAFPSRGSSISDDKSLIFSRDVFPDELPGLPPAREIEFEIELMSGTRPISIPPYRMALAELKELKE